MEEPLETSFVSFYFCKVKSDSTVWWIHLIVYMSLNLIFLQEYIVEQVMLHNGLTKVLVQFMLQQIFV
jgi:hypothetical protein